MQICQTVAKGKFPPVVPWQVKKYHIDNIDTQLKQNMFNVAHKVASTIWDCVYFKEKAGVHKSVQVAKSVTLVCRLVFPSSTLLQNDTLGFSSGL